MDVYEFVRGPLVWLSIIIFVLGCFSRITYNLTKRRQKKILYPVASVKGVLRSILHGVFPFGSRYMRKNPVFTIITVLFHISLMAVPLFLLSHVILWYESWEIFWWSMPERLADLMTVIVILSCVFFMVRRLVVPEVKRVTGVSDMMLLMLIIAPFLTGFLATHQWGPYRLMLILHIISGELLLVTIPFSKLGHMLFFWISRAYMGAEYGKSLNVRDW